MLPGLVLGGNSIAAFYRLTDGKLEALAALCAASTVWSASAYIFIRTANIFKTSQLYYPASAISAIAFAILSGFAVAFSGNGTLAAMVGIAISGAATAWTAQSFTANNIRTADRWIFIAGTVAGGMIWTAAAVISRLAWMETLFFYLAILLLITWAFASPLTRRGEKKYRRIWRTVLAVSVIAGFYAVPVFSPPPPDSLLTKLPGRLWSKTHTTINGRRYVLQDVNSSQDIYTPQGRLQIPARADENLQSAVPVLLNISNRPRPTVQLIAAKNSTLPGTLKKISDAKIRHYRLPAAMNFRRSGMNKFDIRHIHPQYKAQATCKKSADIVMLTTLPENQYPAFLKDFLQYTVVESLNAEGLAAIPSYLLKNPAVFCFMHENFPYSGVLPAPGELWVFSRKSLDLSMKNISRNLQNTLGGYSNATSEMLAILYASPLWNSSTTPYPALEDIKYGNNKLTGSWWWIAIGIAAVFLWRILRLFGERRNIMYSCFNAVENGFSGMGTFLLILSIMLVNSGAHALFLAVAAMSFAFFLAKWNIGGVWAALIGLILLLAAISDPDWIGLGLIAVMIQTMSLTGRMPSAISGDIRSQKQMLHAVFLGMMAASLFISAVWLAKIPLLLAWAMIFAARVPGIWQYGRIGVYYSKLK